MNRIYITPNQKIDAPLLEVLPAYELERDSEPTDPESLTSAGWRYAEYLNTGYRVLVNIRGAAPTRRYSSGWKRYVYAVKVRDVETVANKACDGVCAALGPLKSSMITQADNVSIKGLHPKHEHGIAIWND